MNSHVGVANEQSWLLGEHDGAAYAQGLRTTR
jgi:hypothetical protein